MLCYGAWLIVVYFCNLVMILVFFFLFILLLCLCRIGCCKFDVKPICLILMLASRVCFSLRIQFIWIACLINHFFTINKDAQVWNGNFNPQRWLHRVIRYEIVKFRTIFLHVIFCLTRFLMQNYAYGTFQTKMS